MNEIKVKIRRLWHGYASVRDYIVKDAFSWHKDLLIMLEKTNEWMLVPWKDLSKGKANSERFKSKHDDKVYSLVDYKWSPDTSQKTLF